MESTNELHARIVERFMRKVYMEPQADGCWLWKAYIRPNGYGTFWLDGRNQYAHRVSFEMHNGPLGDLTVDHACRNRRCVNPLHLRAMALAENVGLKEAHKTACPKGHKYDIVRPDGARGCRECRRESSRQWKRRQRQAVA